MIYEGDYVTVRTQRTDEQIEVSILDGEQKFSFDIAYLLRWQAQGEMGIGIAYAMPQDFSPYLSIDIARAVEATLQET